MADFIKCEIPTPSETPTIIGTATPPSVLTDEDQSSDEISKLRMALQNLQERHEEDRKCILILQSQIDHMRGAKCTDSVESSLKLMFNTASYIWSKIPSISMAHIFEGYKKKSKKKSSRGLSSASTSTLYVPKKIKNAQLKSK